MTLSELRQRVREQTGDRYNLENEDDALIGDYINEGMALLLRGRALREGMLRAERGVADLSGLEDFCEGFSLTDERGRVCAFRVQNGRLYTGRDGLYAFLYAGNPEKLVNDADAPAMPESYHGALCDYAAWRVLANGGKSGQARAGFYWDRFQMAKDAFDRQWEGRMGARRITGKYGGF